VSSRDLHERASSLFLSIRELGEAERSRAVEAAAGGNEWLRREVLSLLEHDESGADPADRGCETAISCAEQLPDAPARIGHYTVLRRLGRGGSGYVLLAEQHEPIHQRVAIKIVPHAALSPDLAARFDFERRALERTEHPSIARILDAGRTADGLPWIAMEYVEGVPLSEYCRARSLPLRARIDLVLQVADAVRHAHQRGVIHRDLKPANILVTETAGTPIPKVLDFGIAKPIAGSFGDEAMPQATLPGGAGGPLGTPAYMAPEQTGGRTAVDTRADVFALGAILYELASGRPPLDTDGDPLEVLTRIRDHVPFPCSRVRAQNPALASDPVSRSLLADLDCVLAKALEKEPGRRYASVEAFASDLRRLERGEPIEARPATVRYRAARFAQRNRLLVASLAVVSFAVVAGVTGLSAGLIEATRQRREATNQSESQREINRFLTDDLLAPASPDQQGDKITALDLLKRASRRVDARFPDRPLIAASVHHTIGSAFAELGAFNDAQRHLDRAVELRAASAGPDAPDTVRSELARASLLGLREQYDRAEPVLRALIPRARLILGSDDPALYGAINDLGVTCESLDKGPEAVALLTEALAGRARLLGEHDPQVLITTSNLAQAYDRTGQTQRSLDLMLKALTIADSLGAEDPPYLIILGLCNNIGATLQDMNRDRDAEPYLARASEIAGRWLGPDNPATLSIQANLAGLEGKLGDPARGLTLYSTVIASRMRLLGPDAPDTLMGRYGYADTLWHAGRHDDAAAAYRALLADEARALGETHWLTIQTRASLARALFDGGHAAEARPLADQATSQFLALYGPDHQRTRTTRTLLDQIDAALVRPGPLAKEQGP
jgi:serine/threonine protein kinase